MNSSSSGPPTPEGPGSVSGAPNLPAGFSDTFTSRYVDAGGLRQHVVTGGAGPPLLLVHGWPQNWYAWRLVMPTLARDFEVIAPDQRWPSPRSPSLRARFSHRPSSLLSRSTRGSGTSRSTGSTRSTNNSSRDGSTFTSATSSPSRPVGSAMKSLANDVQTAVIPGAGHWFAEEAPEDTLAALTAFLAPYRDGR